MSVEELRDLLEYTDVDKLIDKYQVVFQKGTMIINKKIPVNDFIRLRDSLRVKKKIKNIVVDADADYINRELGL